MHTNCGQPTQKWYHVPCSWLHLTKNALILLEEVGRDPSGISLRTRYVDIVYAKMSQGYPTLNKLTLPVLQLQCSSRQRLSSISFASFGTPSGFCGNFIKGSCHATNSSSIVEKACLGKKTCSISVSEDVFGSPCANSVKSLAVEAVCRYGSTRIQYMKK